MKTLIRLLLCSVGYIISKVILIGVFSFVYYESELHSSYYDVFLALLAGDSASHISASNLTIWSSYFQSAINFVIDSIWAGYVFAYILNRTPNIIMPKKLVLRHRTSENVDGLLSLGVLVGNRSAYSLHSVRCTISCSYVKQEVPLYLNTEFQLDQEIQQLHNYYRFSFDINRFPKKFLSDFLSKHSNLISREHDYITITLTGNANNLGNTFLVSKKYTLDDIIYDEHIPDLSAIVKNPFTGKTLFKRIKWNNLHVYKTDARQAEKSRREIASLIEESSINSHRSRQV